MRIAAHSRFIFFVAARYFKAQKRDKKVASAALSVAGIGVGVMTLVVVMSVMNGFQLSFIEPILEVKSYHVQVRSRDGRKLSAEQLEVIRGTVGVSSVTPFIDIQAIAAVRRPCLIRGIPPGALEQDAGFAASFSTKRDLPEFRRLTEKNTVVIGSQLAAQLHLGVGDTLPLYTFAGSSFEGLTPREKNLTVTGVFKTGFYEIDLSWAFISLDTADSFRAGAVPVYGIKLTNRFDDKRAIARLEQALGAEGLSGSFRIESWRDFNRVFFGALMTEKMLMMFLIGLIFVVVGFNIFHSLRKSVYERLDEIATLKALGASTRTVQHIFVSEGFMIGLIGAAAGLALGLLIAGNINAVFRLVEEAANGVILPLVAAVVNPIAGKIPLGSVSIFSPSVFYIDAVPTRILLSEMFAITLFSVLCASLAAYFASRRISGVAPSAILRIE